MSTTMHVAAYGYLSVGRTNGRIGIPGHSLRRIYADRQLPGAPEINSPNSFQALPSNLTNCICLIGA